MKINLGCRNRIMKDYINIDFDDLVNLKTSEFLCANALEIDKYFTANSVDEVFSAHFLEHLSHYEITNLLYKIWVILKHDGYLISIVPDFAEIMNVYRNKHIVKKDFSDVDILHIKIFDVPEEGLHKTVWYEEIGRYYFTREDLFVVEEISKPSEFELRFVVQAKKVKGEK